MNAEKLADVTRAIREELADALEDRRRLEIQLAEALALLRGIKREVGPLAGAILSAVECGYTDDQDVTIGMRLSLWREIALTCGCCAS
jgi:hypothetical protein